MNNKKIRVGILGATGFVGQRFVSLLEHHPWFEITVLAASMRSAGKKYGDCMKGKWYMNSPLPKKIANIVVSPVDDIKFVSSQVDFVFSALNMDKEEIKKLEAAYADAEIPVVSNNSAHRWTSDVPMIIPEVNPGHVALIDFQRKKSGRVRGFIAVKPNCSIQSYVAILQALKKFKPYEVMVTSMQAISGAGKTFAMWPEMVDNLIPYIGGEEEKSEKEPQKIWGILTKRSITPNTDLKISATCIRVPASDGHMAAVRVHFHNNPSREQIINAIRYFKNPLDDLELPSAPKPFIQYHDEPDRPQTKLDRDASNGMMISMGRLEKDTLFDWKFIALSHNTVRGAAGGAILVAELLHSKGYL